MTGRPRSYRRVLSQREAEVLRLVAEGYTNPEIATALHISVNTTKSTVARILTILGARNRAHAVWIGLVPERVRSHMSDAVNAGVPMPVGGAA